MAEQTIVELIRRPPTPVELPEEDLLAVAQAKTRRLYFALATILSLNLAMVSGAVTFWALALRN